MHLPALIRDLAIILGVAGVVTILFRALRQPVVLGYILAGVLVGPHMPWLPTVTDIPNIRTLAELGVVFFLFSLGLEFSFRRLQRVGSAAPVIGIVQVSATAIVGYSTAKFLGWKELDAIFLGALLCISSTTIIIKAFEELQVKTRRFTETVFGVLIVEDIFAILVLIALTSIALTREVQGVQLLISLGKLGLILPLWVLTGLFLVPALFKRIRRWMTAESLTVLSIAMCLLLVLAATELGYSAALAAFIMGAVLAETAEGARIEEMIRPIRDLFGAIFFVSVGMLFDPGALVAHAGEIALITAVFMVTKVVSAALGGILVGRPYRNAVQVGMSLAQIGEFSFIIATLGATLQVTSDHLYPIAVSIALVTSFLTPYLIGSSDRFVDFLERRLPRQWTAFLRRYEEFVNRSSTDQNVRTLYLARMARWLLNAIIVVGVFRGVALYVMPRIAALEVFAELSPNSLRWVSLTLAGCLGLPFLWAMFNTFKAVPVSGVGGPREMSHAAVFFLTVARVGTLLLTWLMSLAYLSPFEALILALVLLLTGAMFYARLERTYEWFESQLTRNLEGQSQARSPGERHRRLAPWDAHLVELVVHPNSACCGKMIREVEPRKNFGVNIVALDRGAESIVAPNPDERLMPMDTVTVLGTDAQLGKFRSYVELPVASAAMASEERESEYQLRNVRLAQSSDLVGKTIREAKLRERFNGIVVGLERGSDRWTNPDPAIRLAENDILWVVGKPEDIKALR